MSHCDPTDNYPQSLVLSQLPEGYALRACRTVEKLAQRRGASLGELREVLEALGLDGVAQ